MTLLLALIVSPSMGGEFITSVSEVTTFTRAATWVRSFPRDDSSWWLLMGMGGDYGISVLGADMSWDEREMVALTGRTGLIDHAINHCPDGTYLHAASGNVTNPNDSAYAFTYDAEWNLVGSGTIEENVSGTAHNDMALLCGGGHRVVGFSSMGGGVFHHIDAEAQVKDKTSVSGVGFITGGGMLANPDTGGLFLATNGQNNQQLFIYELDSSYGVVEKHTIEAAPSGQKAYWPQGFLRVGDYYILGFMARDESQGWSQDTGNVWLLVMDQSFNVLERAQISQHEAPEGAMRPWVTRNGDTLLVTADQLVRPQIYTVTLDAVAFGLEEGGQDTFVPNDSDGDPNDDSQGGDDSQGDGDKGGAGCGRCASGSSTGLGGLWAALGLAFWRRQRR